MVITDFQDFLASKYYNGTSIMAEFHGRYFLTFKIPECKNGTALTLKDVNFLVGTIPEYFHAPLIYTFQEKNHYFPHILRIFVTINGIDFRNIYVICLGQAYNPFKLEIDRIYKGLPASLTKIAMLTESVLNIKYGI